MHGSYARFVRESANYAAHHQAQASAQAEIDRLKGELSIALMAAGRLQAEADDANTRVVELERELRLHNLKEDGSQKANTPIARVLRGTK